MESLKALDYLTISQLRRLHDLKGKRNAEITLQRMEKEGYIRSFRVDRQKVFYLSKKGRHEIGGAAVRRKTLAIDHFLLRNDVYLKFRPPRWKNEPLIKVSGQEIRPDALFATKDGRQFLLEVDITRSMKDNRDKIQAYKKLKKGLGDRFPVVMFATISEFRRSELKRILSEIGGIVLTERDIY